MSRFLRPDTDTLTLANGDKLIVRRRLTAGEGRVFRGQRAIQTLVQAALVMAYLVDWTLAGDDGAVVPIRGISQSDLLNVLDSLEDDSFDEIHAAIAAHVATMDSQRTEEKKLLTGTSSAVPISD